MIHGLLRVLLVGLCLAMCLATGRLNAQDRPPAPGGETLHEYRDKALLETSARPTGAYGLEGNPDPVDTWISGGEQTIKLVGGAIVVLLILRWLWKRRSVNYA
jgi:hypothetical protein